jgi:transposase
MKVYIGIDWSEEKHDIVFMNEAGAEIAYLSIPHSQEGFLQLETARVKFGFSVTECVVGLETAHNLLLDYLVDQGYQVYILPPSVVDSNQGRFRQSRAKDDPADARLIADILRTDHGRLHPWKADNLLTRQMRAKLSWSMQLAKQIVITSNRLRSVLLRYYPAALHVFTSGLATQIAPAFVLAYPTPQAAKALTLTEFITFARQHRYPRPKQLPQCFARLQTAYPQANSEIVLIYQSEAVQLAHLLQEMTHIRLQVQAELQALYIQHPKYAVFSSLPGAGEVIGPGLLTHFGDDLERFPYPGTAQALAGTAPVTKTSGKHRTVEFRRACDKEWRFICQEWANALVNRVQSPVAVAYYHQIRPHCHSEQHALRCVANRWLAVAWKLWQTGEIYDVAYHLKQRELRSQPR